jgi:hypothetical protein
MVDVHQEHSYSKKLQDKKKAAAKKSSKSGDSGGLLSGIGGEDIAGILAESVEKQAASQRRQAAQKSALTGTGPTDPFSLLQQQLFNQANSINIPMTPIEELRKIAEQQVRAQYDPQINALMAQMGSTGKRARGDQRTAREMYGALSKDYLAQLPEITQQFAAEDAAVNQRYDQAQAQMQAEYQKNAGQQDALLKQLGIQAAAPDASAEMQNDQAYFNNSMESDQQATLNALAEQQMAQQDYTRNLGNSATMAGENLASDIGRQLEDYLQQSQSQLSTLQGQRGSAIEALLAQMQAQDQQRAEQARQQQFDNMMKMFQFQLDATKASNQAGAVAGSGGFGGGEGLAGLTTGLQGANNYLASIYPDQPIMASNLMEQLNKMLQSQEVVDGKFILEPGNEAHGIAPKYSDVGQERMMDILRRQFEGMGDRYGTQDINATMNALLAYLGKLR